MASFLIMFGANTAVWMMFGAVVNGAHLFLLEDWNDPATFKASAARGFEFLAYALTGFISVYLGVGLAFLNLGLVYFGIGN